MPFDPNSLWDVSHLVAFVGGAAVGAAGTYLGDRFTDQRRKSEARSKADAEFARIKKLMPALIAELAADLRNSSEHVLREFVILGNERLRFMHDKPRIEIYETKHPAAKNQGFCPGERRVCRGDSKLRHPYLPTYGGIR
jgi:hypothetical protein